MTIFGQSAGAMSVAAHLVSPPAAGLFQAAILESNPLTIAWSNEENALAMADKFAVALNCTAGNTACLRAAKVSDILVAQVKAIRIDPTGPLQAFVPWLPWVDGKVIAGQPLTLFATGDYSQVPIQIGTVQSEGVLFVYSGFPTPIPNPEYVVIITGLFQIHAPAVLSRYACTNHTDCRPTMSRLATDYVFACPSRNATRNMIKYNPKAYMYHFDHLINADGNNTNIWGPNFAECQYQICHGSELPYVFNSLELPPSPYVWGPGELAFSHSMATYWGNFGNSHSPNSPNAVPTTWPIYTTASDTYLRMYYDNQVNFPLEQGYLQSACDYWDTIGYGWGTFY
ncbi:MAG: carboxylesterase family protein [archaeon]|nr:carboxylesterase family protein [archaeon]